MRRGAHGAHLTALSTPSFLSAATFSALPAVAITRAPVIFAICTTIEPTPPVPPLTKIVSPAFRSARLNRPKCAVMPTSAQAAASSSEMPLGVG